MINYIINNSVERYNKVDIVAHGMGGIVLSHYVKKHSNSKIKKMITLGTPYDGLPQTFLASMTSTTVGHEKEQHNIKDGKNKWEAFKKDVGENFGDSIMFLKVLNRETKCSFPSMSELIPSRALFSSHENYYRRKIEKSEKKLEYEEYEEICKSVYGKNNFEKGRKSNDSLKNGDEFSTHVLYDLNDSYFAVGIAQYTINGMRFKGSGSEYFCDDLYYEKMGDGTVPFASASMFLRLFSEKEIGRVKFFETTHGGLVKGNESLEWIRDILKESSDLKSIKKIPESTSEDYKKFVVRVACPVDINIEFNGEKLSSNLEDFSSISSFGRLDLIGENDDIEMLCLDDEIYTINLNGTKEGEMTLEMRWIDENNGISDNKVFRDVKITPQTKITTITDKNNEIILNVDENGDGIIDKKLEAEAEILEEEKIELENKNEKSVAVYFIIGIGGILLVVLGLGLKSKMKK